MLWTLRCDASDSIDPYNSATFDLYLVPALFLVVKPPIVLPAIGGYMKRLQVGMTHPPRSCMSFVCINRNCCLRLRGVRACVAVSRHSTA